MLRCNLGTLDMAATPARLRWALNAQPQVQQAHLRTCTLGRLSALCVRWLASRIIVLLQSTAMSPAVEELCAIRPDEIEILQRNGQDWLLGAGGFGAVCLLLPCRVWGSGVRAGA